MANNTYINTVVYNGDTLIDLSLDTVTTAGHIALGYTGHLADGSRVTGTGTELEVLDFTDIEATGNGTVTVSGSSSSGSNASLQSKTKTYTPTEITQTETVTADTGYDGLSSVGITINPIPSQYVVPSGSQTYTSNGTYDVAGLSEAVINVSSGGSGIKTGTITPASASTSLTFDTGLSTVSGILVMPVNTPLTGSRTQAGMICLKTGSFYQAISIHTNSGGTGWISPTFYTSSYRFTQSGTSVTVSAPYNFRPETGYIWFAW